MVALGLLLGGCQLAFGITTVTGDGPGVDGGGLPGVVAHYTLDTLASGPCLPDDSGNDHAGTCHGDAVTLVAGRIGQAFSFDGATRIEIPSTGSLAGPGPFTFAGWVELGSPPTNGMCPFNRLLGDKGLNPWQICLYTFAVRFYFTSAPTATAPALEPGGWHHLAVMSTGTEVRSYVDGALIDDQPGVLVFDDQPLVIGADIDPAGVTNPTTGAVDDVWIFDRVLSMPELLTLAVP